MNCPKCGLINPPSPTLRLRVRFRQPDNPDSAFLPGAEPAWILLKEFFSAPYDAIWITILCISPGYALFREKGRRSAILASGKVLGELVTEKDALAPELSRQPDINKQFFDYYFNWSAHRTH